MPIVRDAQSGDRYRDKLGKILPSELTATYFVLRTLAGDEPVLTPFLIGMALLLCIAFYVVAPKLINMLTSRNRVLYCVTFVLWFVAIDQFRIATDIFTFSQQGIQIFVYLTSGIAAIWSFAVPYFMQQTE